MGLYELLKNRGYLYQLTHEEELREKLNEGGLNFYIGIDATADSLTAGHFLTLVVLKHFQNAGHRPIILIGGGTTLIGDPSERDEMRKIMTRETINHNAECIKNQISKIIDFSDDKAIMVNNADWLVGLNYLEFLRDYGKYFLVNKMVNMQNYQARLQDGLTLLEFNYLPMQSYDYYYLNENYNCTLQIGGSDQWSNILGGADLIKRIKDEQVYCLTLNLLTTSDGTKMGKTAKGAVWLDPNKTSVYEFFQYWRNVEDESLLKYLNQLTILDDEKIKELTKSSDAKDINRAKEVLAYEITKMAHSKEEADIALETSRKVFSGDMDAENMPSTDISKDDLGKDWLSLLVKANIIKTKSEGRRLMSQNGLSLNDNLMDDPNQLVSDSDFSEGYAIIKKGKKHFHKFVK